LSGAARGARGTAAACRGPVRHRRVEGPGAGIQQSDAVAGVRGGTGQATLAIGFVPQREHDAVQRAGG
ncbi:hypothetical protein KQ752_15300, partial [Listeria monocytogenes]|nr:hypothetical protein [Listeria monocytogenes]